VGGNVEWPVLTCLRCRLPIRPSQRTAGDILQSHVLFFAGAVLVCLAAILGLRLRPEAGVTPG